MMTTARGHIGVGARRVALSRASIRFNASGPKPMLGLMQSQPLLISSLIEFSALYHPDVEIVSRTVEGPIHRTTYAEINRRAKQLARALIARGVKPGDRVATLAWNGYRHMELYFAVSGMGAVLHTVNPRLFPEQIEYIINHAEDTHVFFDATFGPDVFRRNPLIQPVSWRNVYYVHCQCIPLTLQSSHQKPYAHPPLPQSHSPSSALGKTESS